MPIGRDEGSRPLSSPRDGCAKRLLPRLLAVGALVAALILAGCASGRASTPTATATAPAQDGVQSSPTPFISAPLLQTLEGIEGRVSKQRGLSAVLPPDRSFLTRTELGALLAMQLEEENPDEEMAIVQEVLIALGLLEEGQELKGLLLDQLSQQVLGLFDPETGKLYVVREGQRFGPLQAVAYAHEYAHALQQDRFDLRAMQKRIEEDSEASAALTALVEGDATLLQILYAQQHLSSGERRRLAQEASAAGEDEAPFYLRESLIFPYREGLDFVLSLYRAGGWRAVDRAYEAPPASTEQVMHPEKYRAQERPLEVPLPGLRAALGDGWEEKKAETLGEFDLKLFLQLHIPAFEAARAAAGWGGDRLVFWKGPRGERLLVLLVRWDTSGDAGEFFEAYLRSLRRQGAEPQVTSSSIAWSAAGRYSSLRLQGDGTLLVLAPDGPTAERVWPLFPEFAASP